MIGECRFYSIFFASLEENLLLRHQKLMFLFPHGTPQEIRLSKGKARQNLDDLHDLLLVEDDAKCLLENRLEKRMQINDLFFSMQAIDKIGHHTTPQRPWTIEGNRRNEVDKTFGLKILDEICHACRFHLKDSTCISSA